MLRRRSRAPAKQGQAHHWPEKLGQVIRRGMCNADRCNLWLSDRHEQLEELMMQKAGFLLALVLSFSVAAAAQQTTPRIEIFGGYSHFFGDLNNTSSNLDGVHVSAAENLNSWLGGVFDFSTHYGTRNGVNINTQSIMYGPRFTYRKSKLVTPSAHFLFGAVHGSPGFDDISMSNYRFSVAAGGALDVRITDRVAFRVVQADYMLTRFLNLRQDNIRVSTGLVFRIPRW